jgi:hypothetical protein
LAVTTLFLIFLGFQDRPNIRSLYHESWLPTMSDPQLWATKSNDVLIAYVMCIFEYMYATDASISEIMLNQLRNVLLIKTNQNKFVSLGTEKNFFHLTKTYGARCSTDQLPLNSDQYHFIADDYFQDYRQEEIFAKLHLERRFFEFLSHLNIHDFFSIASNDIRESCALKRRVSIYHIWLFSICRG